MRGDRLGSSQKQKAIRFEGIVEDRDHAVLQLRAQIDQDVAAANKVQPREGRILKNILFREHASFADVFSNLVSAIEFHKESLQARGRNILDLIRRVHT